MAHKKAGGSSRNGRDTAGRRLGVKLFGGQEDDRGATSSFASAAPSTIPAPMSGIGRDHTLFALVDGPRRLPSREAGPHIRLGGAGWVPSRPRLRPRNSISLGRPAPARVGV